MMFLRPFLGNACLSVAQDKPLVRDTPGIDPNGKLQYPLDDSDGH